MRRASKRPRTILVEAAVAAAVLHRIDALRARAGILALASLGGSGLLAVFLRLLRRHLALFFKLPDLLARRLGAVLRLFVRRDGRVAFAGIRARRGGAARIVLVHVSVFLAFRL